MTAEKTHFAGESLAKIVHYLDEMLETSTTPDYPSAINGLQLANKTPIRKVAGAVDFSTQTVSAAILQKANLLIVHHGMFWSGLQPIVGHTYARLRSLLDADIAVYASHLPLDRHPQIGNNVLLAKILGLEPSGEFARFRDIFVGIRGETTIPILELAERARLFSRANGGEAIIASANYPHGITRRWAICTGAGASADTLTEATEQRIDTLLVGEGPHWTAVDAQERGLTIIYLGHYASETLGVYALADNLGERFNLEVVKISAPTGL